MGVKGLWDLIRPAGVRTTLQGLAREAVVSGRGTYKIGIDASIWIFHARDVKGGENPSLRTVFYRVLALLQHPVTPIFVFDGPHRPVFKRGNRVGGHFGMHDEDSKKFKRLLDMWGISWLQAPGEAEAELAILNKAGRIDAILSDDADAFIFGARAVLRNNSPELSGSKAAGGISTASKDVHSRDYVLYRIEDIVRHLTSEDSALQTEKDCNLAMVLLALLSGGDYQPQGIASIGPKISMGLAKAGLSRPLAHYLNDLERFTKELPAWQEQLVEELRHDLSGYIGRKNKVLAERLASIDSDVLLKQLPLKEYLRPTVTPEQDRDQKWRRLDDVDAASLGRGSLTGAAQACELFFEWGTPDLVVKKFGAKHSIFTANVITSALTSEVLSESAVVRVHDVKASKLDTGQRDVVVDCQWSTYATSCRSVMVGSRPDPSTLPPDVRLELGLVEVARQAAPQPEITTSRIKLPEYLFRRAWQSALDDYEKAKEERAAGKAKKTKSKPKPKSKVTKDAAGSMNIRDFLTVLPPSQTAVVEPRSDSPPPIEVASSPVPSIFSESPPAVPLSSSPPSASISPTRLPASRTSSRPNALLVDTISSDAESEHDDSVVIIEPPVLVPPLSPSKRGRRAASKNGSSRSHSPAPKRGASGTLVRGSSADVASGTKDDPISLSDSESEDDDAIPRLRMDIPRPDRATPTPSAPKRPPATAGAGAKCDPRGTAASKSSPVPETSPVAELPRKARTPDPSTTLEQTRLQGFFKPHAKVGAAASKRVKKKEKEKYRVEEKDGVEVYHFL